MWYMVKPPDSVLKSSSIPKRQILDTPKMKEFEKGNFKFDENGRKFSKRVENTMGKGESARQKLFLFFTQCFNP